MLELQNSSKTRAFSPRHGLENLLTRIGGCPNIRSAVLVALLA
jgi:hypothetical protein